MRERALMIRIQVGQVLTHGQNTIQAHMRHYIILKAYGCKGNHAYMSLKGNVLIKGEQDLTQDEIHGHMGAYMEAHAFIGRYKETHGLMSLIGHGLGLVNDGRQDKVQSKGGPMV